MKTLSIVFFSLLIGGCVFTGKDLIHSPKALGGNEIRLRHIHGGATKNSPPDIVGLKSLNDDSTSIFVSAKHIEEKKMWGGIGVPIFPIFFLPKIDY